MHWITHAIDIALHLDRYLNQWAGIYGAWLYAILFAVIFAETGLVVTPFLPGDSLLFAVGALTASQGSPLHVSTVLLILIAAAVLGNTTNYYIGRWMGPKAMGHDGRFLKKKYLDETHAFFERYGGPTIIVTRFVPIIRTFAPFVAGVGRMSPLRFQFFNVLGGGLWVALLVLAGYWFGARPVVKANFSLVIVAIVIISILPAAIGWLRTRRGVRKEPV
jgi:membrane-associated protein